jgi:predicted anti-sigma-YlaC factor YlaD
MREERRFGKRNECTNIRDRIEAFVLEDVSPREALRIERHLARCAACRTTAQEERGLFALLAQALEPQQPPPEVLLNVLRRVGGSERSRRSWSTVLGMAISAAVAASVMLVIQPTGAATLARALGSPDVAVINLFAAVDSPLTSHYEFRTQSRFELDGSVGRILFNVVSGEWQLVVHGLPRPPHGARYVLSAQIDREDEELGTIERWENGVAVLKGRSPDVDLTRTERLSITLVSDGSRLRLLESVDGAW